MPRANRYILPGGAYHLTHRCHNKSWLFRIELNMVRAGAVSHPEEWKWCGFAELAGARQRYRMIDFAAVPRVHGVRSREEFAEAYRANISEALATGRFLERDPIWTDDIAVGSEPFGASTSIVAN